ncbi:hypothetical protein [Dyadobacter jiangsuensis]|uniref:Uncharacterized protein n=1 Tax=Dyadobacter jiangsuensis TaxID=1591085 RepID=A0A2P8FP77_9BACT|nr:hypothetical protein [Dyadobacter jiangsuensis]PSL23465.1 hypothetical protein CLV60_11620 [Dyadobacter jiangsuensis]
MAKGRKTGGRKAGSKNIISADIRYLAQSYANTAIEVLFGLMTNSKQDVVKISAARELLDRAYGKPSPMELPKGEDEEAVPVLVKVEVIDARKVDA